MHEHYLDPIVDTELHWCVLGVIVLLGMFLGLEQVFPGSQQEHVAVLQELIHRRSMGIARLICLQEWWVTAIDKLEGSGVERGAERRIEAVLVPW